MNWYRNSGLWFISFFLVSCALVRPPERGPRIVVGDVASLAAGVFSKKSWRKGLRDKTAFMHEAGFGIYFLEEYDSNKIPILFISGINAGPRSWGFFIREMDRKRYQPWIFSYPSGMAINESSDLLNQLVSGLHQVYGFKKMHLTAHGTGGLVARAFILKNRTEESGDYLGVFISIATPWGGVGRDALRMFGMSDDIPALTDVQTGSRFLDALYDKHTDDDIDHYIFLAYAGGKGSFGSLKSQLDFRVQSGAIKEYGFYEDYLGILSAGEVVKRFSSIIAAEDVQ